MSSKLSDLLVDLSEDLDLQQRYAQDPEAVMTEYGLNDDEKAALRAGDEAKILKQIGEKSGGLKPFKIVIRVGPKKS